MDRIDYRDVANAKISSRLKQVVTLIVAILLGMIISIGVNAQGNYHKNKNRHYKAKFREQRSQHSNACDILNKKRTETPKSNPRLAFNNKNKYRPMAEVDSPGSSMARADRKRNERLD